MGKLPPKTGDKIENVSEKNATDFFGLAVEDQCPKCWGVGYYPFNPHNQCSKCSGTGRKSS
jgi:DnaJ-class molecular chaperone